MKKSEKTNIKKTKGVSKGRSSGLIISIAIHAAAFALAGMLVVFTVIEKKDNQFTPPKPVDRPKMKLKKPKVQLKKNAKPKSTNRIVTKVDKASMPEIQLPELSGMGDGLAGGLGGGFDLAPDLEVSTLFGSAQSVGNDFVGTFYDFNRDRSGRPIPMAPETMFNTVKNFMAKGWKPSVLSRYYRAPQQLFATHFCIPTDHSTLGPEAFGQPDAKSWCWLVHYKGQLVYPEDIKIRFWGQGDDHMIVRINGKVVLIACWPTSAEPYYTSIWQTSSADSRKYPLGNNMAVVGDWIELKAGVPLQMEVLIGEGAGGLFEALLTVEVEGEKYPRNPFMNGPKLPIFKTAELPQDTVDSIQNMLYESDASVTNGPTFKDYISKSKPSPKVEPQPDSTPQGKEDPMRVWTATDGNTLEAEYVTRMGQDVVVKDKKGRQRKLPFRALSPQDQEYVELIKPPPFKLSFTKTSNQVQPAAASPFVGLSFPIRMFDYTFGVRVKQGNDVEYDHPLRIEYFAIGEEVDGNNFILLERNEDTFVPTPDNKREYEFHGDPIRIKSKAIWESHSPMRGSKYGGYLIVMSDKNGRVVDYKASHEFLYTIVNKLRVFPETRHFDKEGDRVSPPRPTDADRNPWVFGRN